MSKREELREKRRKREQRQRIITIAIVAVVAVAVVALLVGNNFVQSLQPVGSIVTVTPYPRPEANGLSMGNPNATVKVVEYADFQCPYCRQYTETIEPTIIQNFVETGKIYFTFVPFSFIGQESLDAANAAYCANAQGKFWAFHDMLFANQGQTENAGAFTQKRLIAFGEALGLNKSEFQSCVSGNTYASQVQQDIVQANQAGVTSTPSFIVNGKLVSMTDLQTTIQTALAAASK